MECFVIKKSLVAVLALIAGTQIASAFPTWMGVYGEFKRHDGNNPGTFTVLMNENYPDLQAEIGIQVNGGSLEVYRMGFVGVRDGNSEWQFRLPYPLPDGAAVSYYFHGFDRYSQQIWDSNNSANYSFVAQPAGGLQFGSGSAQTNVTAAKCVVGDRVFLVNQGSVCRGSIAGNQIVWSSWNKVAGESTSIGGVPGNLFAASASGNQLTIWRSQDDGETFTSKTISFPGEQLKTTAVAARGSDVVVAFGKIITTNSYNSFYPHQLWTILSTNGGATWGTAKMAAGYDPNSNSTYIQEGWEFGATSNAFILGYTVIFPGASHRSFQLLSSLDGNTWANRSIQSGKYVGSFDVSISSGGAIACAATMDHTYPDVLVWGGTNWVDARGNLRVRAYTGDPISVGMFGSQPLFFKQSQVQSNVFDVWTTDANFNPWSIVASVKAPSAPTNSYVAPPQVLSGNTRLFLQWSHGFWQNSTPSCPALQWAGHTYSSPADSSLTALTPLWINTESWPVGGGDEAIVVYSTDQKTWKAAPMALNGQIGNNDAWHANLGTFPGGTIVQYAIAVVDCNGNYLWDSRGGQNYKATVKAAQPVQWIGNTYTWPANGQVKPTTDLWINTESWAKGTAVSGLIVYSLDGSTWNSKPLNKAGINGNNDWWSANLGKFSAGTQVRFAVMVQDANGLQKWDNNGGQNFKVTVQ